MSYTKKICDQTTHCNPGKRAGMIILLQFVFCCLMVPFTGCHSQGAVDSKGNEQRFTKFPEEQKLTSTDYLKIDLFKPQGLSLYADSVFIIKNAVNGVGHHFSLFSIKGRTFLSNQLEAGGKAGQSLGFISYGSFDQYLWVHDLVKKKLIVLNMDSALRAKNPGLPELSIPAFYYSVQMLSNSKVIVSGDYESQYKISILGLPSNVVEKQLIPYATDSLVIYPRAKKMAYESFLFLKPSGDKCVLAARYADQIELVDLATQKSQIIKGPKGDEPEMVTMKSNDGKELSTRGPDTKYGFVRGKMTNRYIYLLYSGNHDDTEHLFYGKYIYVYDWNGKPVKKIELEDYVLDFAVTSNDSLLYSFDPVTNFIKVSKL